MKSNHQRALIISLGCLDVRKVTRFCGHCPHNNKKAVGAACINRCESSFIQSDFLLGTEHYTGSAAFPQNAAKA